MRIVSIEDHFTTSKHNRATQSERRESWVRLRAEELGYDINSSLLNLDEIRLAAMDAAGIDYQVVSLTAPGCQAFQGAESIAIARDANDQLADAVRRHPHRLGGFAALPTSEPMAAAAELERCVKSLGFKGALINGHTDGRFLDEREFWPIFETAEALDVPIYLHPTAPHPGMLDSYFRGYDDLARAPWGFAVEASCHFLRILFSGVFDEFPKLKIILGHMGEGIPFGFGRLREHTRHVARARGLKRSTVEYLTDNLVITTSGVLATPTLQCAMMTVGVDNIIFSVDWPYESNSAAVQTLDHMALSAVDKAKIAHLNAERILRLA